MYFSADIGTWERGEVKHFEADSHDEAIKKAFTFGDVVQIRELPTANEKDVTKGKVFYDYINGKYDL